MPVVALGQQKGGCGKSAVAVNLACEAVTSGESAVVIDMDADQGTSLNWGKQRQGRAPAVLAADLSTLPDVLKRVSAKKWVILDLPGRHASIASAGLMAADFILVPCRPLDVDVGASAPTVHALQRAKKRYAYLMNIAPAQHDKMRAKAVSRILQDAGQPVCPVVIASRIIVPVALSMGKSVAEAYPSSDSATEFRELFQWVRKNVR